MPISRANIQKKAGIPNGSDEILQKVAVLLFLCVYAYACLVGATQIQGPMETKINLIEFWFLMVTILIAFIVMTRFVNTANATYVLFKGLDVVRKAHLSYVDEEQCESVRGSKRFLFERRFDDRFHRVVFLAWPFALPVKVIGEELLLLVRSHLMPNRILYYELEYTVADDDGVPHIITKKLMCPIYNDEDEVVARGGGVVTIKLVRGFPLSGLDPQSLEKSKQETTIQLGSFPKKIKQLRERGAFAYLYAVIASMVCHFTIDPNGAFLLLFIAVSGQIMYHNISGSCASMKFDSRWNDVTMDDIPEAVFDIKPPLTNQSVLEGETTGASKRFDSFKEEEDSTSHLTSQSTSPEVV